MDNLILTLREVFEAEADEAEARERYEGYDWGYHGFQYAEASRKAVEAFGKALDAVIDARVRAILESKAGFVKENGDE
jgi:hypothetical protein